MSGSFALSASTAFFAAAAGVVIVSADGEVLHEEGRYLGRATNNVAEYRALLAGIAAAPFFAVDPGDHGEVVGIGDFVCGHQTGTKHVTGVEVFAAAAQTRLAAHVLRLHVARAHIVENGVTENVISSLFARNLRPGALGNDRPLEFVIQAARFVGPDNIVVGANHIQVIAVQI